MGDTDTINIIYTPGTSSAVHVEDGIGVNLRELTRGTVASKNREFCHL